MSCSAFRVPSSALALALGLAMPAFAQDKVTFQKHIKPIFENNCNKCHNPDKAKGDVDLTTVAAILAGGAGGAIASPGDGGGSSLFQTMAHLKEPFMPQKASKLPDAEIELVKKWIDGGMLDSETSVALKPKKPKVDLAMAAGSLDKPDGPPPMPGDLILQPVVVTARANAITALAHSPWAPVLAVGSQSQVLLYNTDTLDLAGVLPFPEGNVFSVKFARNARYVIAGGGVEGKSGKAVLYELESGRRIFEVGGDYDSILAADISSDLRHVATGSTDKFVKIYAVDDGRRLFKIKKHTEWVTAVSFSPDGVLLATGDRNGGVQVWEVATGQEFYSLRGHEQRITSLSWRRDSNVLASSSDDGTVRLWNMGDGAEVKKWACHEKPFGVDFAPDGSLFTAGKDRLARHFNADGGEVAKYEPFDDIVTAVVSNHDGTRVIAGDWNGKLSVFHAGEKKLISRFDAAPASLESRLAAAVAEREAAKPGAAAAQDVFNQKKAAETALVERIGKADAVIADKGKAVGEGEGKWKEFESTIAQASSVQGETDRVINELAGQIEGKKGEIGGLEKTLAEKQAALAAAQAVTNQPPEQVKAQVDAIQNEINGLTGGLNAAKADLAAKEQQRQQQVDAKAQREKNAADAKVALDALRPQLDGWRGEKAAAEKDRGEASAALEATRKELADADAKLKEAQGRLAGAEAQVKRWEAAQFNLQVHAARRAVEEKEAAIRAQEDALVQQQAAVQQAQNEKAAAEEQFKKLQAEYQARKGS